MLKIAVGGSAANPPHLGHKLLLQQLLDCCCFDVIIWIPSGDRIDKDITTSPDDRVAMTELAIPKFWRVQNNCKFVIKYDEVYGLSMKSYERLLRIKQEYSEKYEMQNSMVDVKWFTGSDSNILEWSNGNIMLKQNMILFIPREGWLPHHPDYKNPIDYEFEQIPDIRSSGIREMVRCKHKIDHLVDEHVSEYIRKENLYAQ